MRTLVVLPHLELQSVDAERAIVLSERRFASLGPVAVVAPPDSLPYYREQLPDYAIGLFDVPSCCAEHDTFIFVEGYTGQMASPGPQVLPLPRPDTQRTYWFMLGARLKLIHPATYDEFEFPHVNSHVFQRLSGRKHEYVNFPYGPLYSDVEVGPVNEFGFRIPPDYRKYAVRARGHKLAVVLGGSAAFSYYCRPEEMFASRLEAKLNATLAESGGNTRFTVLNFGMHDNVVMQEMLTYMLFVHELKPDFVLVHDGHNDIYYGVQDDPYLLNHFDVIYQRYSEEWSKLLHKTSDLTTPDLYSIAHDALQLNLPQNIIRVYMKRKRQFEHMVQSDGGTFIWGVQPLHCSKGRLSERERLKYSQAERFQVHSPAKRKFLRCLYYAYGMLSEELAGQPDITLVDFNRRFQAYDERWELLWDHCHTSPAGDEIIADGYHDAVIGLIVGRECGAEAQMMALRGNYE
jgi:lysophospholipase L1-like esterase